MSASVKIVHDAETLPLSVGTFDFAGYEGTYESTYLGSLTSGPDWLIATDNNGRNSLSNSITGGKTLTLNSSARSIRPEGFENYIQAKITLPAGNLRIYFDYSLTIERAEASAGPVLIKFLIGDTIKSFYLPAGIASKSDSGSFNYGFAREQEVIFAVRSSTHDFRDSNSEGTLKAEFTPAEIVPPEVPSYPKDITRGPYTITVDDLEQETQAKEFLGIEPPGDDLDTWLSKRDLAGLEEWKAYWTDIFSRIGMAFWIGFVNDKFQEYKDKLVVPPTIFEVFLGLLPKPVKDIITFIAGLTHADINETLERLLKQPDGETLIETLGMKAFDELVKEAPEYAVLRDAPKGSVSIAIIIGIVTVILGIGTVVGWLRKEAPEPTGMAVWAMIEAKDWEGADKANKQYKDFISKMNHWIPVVISWLNPFLAAFLGINRDAQLAGADAYQGLIDIELAVKKGTLVINPTPSDAKVSVEGQYSTTGTWSAEILIGPYDWTVSKYGYISKSGTAEVLEDTTTLLEGAEVTIVEEVDEELPPEEVKGNLTISAIDSKGSAEGIIIEIAGQPDIVTPGTYELLTGSYSVKASKEGFISRTKTAYVNEAKDTVVSFILEEVEAPAELPTKATIIIISEPTNSDIYIDGDYTFTKTPYTTVLDAGTYIIRVQTDGYYPLEATVTFGAGDEMEVPFILQEIPPEVEPTVTYDPYQPYLPSYQPATYYTPAVQPTPYSQISLPDYSLIAAPTYKSVIEPVFPGPVEKEIMINIETTDVKPWKGKIFSIAWKDLTTPGAETQVIVDEDEKGLLVAFLNEFNVGNYKTIIGYNLKFDYQWIFNKLMLYRIPANKFYEADMRDVFQLMSQVKEEFVYNARAYGKLDEYAKELLGIGKMGTQETLLKRYISGDTAYVEAFQVRQIEITNGLYQLFRYSASEGSIQPIPSTSELELTTPGYPKMITAENTGQKQCINCKAFNPIENKECFICHQALGP